ncbi:MAG: hypothetical protein GY847_15930 [Proteobacteria bacterium]|nr:hypothetical protein [Pseudomonadota bacterium]
MNRGSKPKDVFSDDDHCSLFCDILGEAVERFDLRIHGFALMPNHYHLMVESVHGNLSDAISLLNGKYTQAVNRDRDLDGPLFRGRYHNRVVTDPSHWRYLLMYLHLNPIRARLVMRVDQWIWTSHRFYNGKNVSPDWLTTDELASELGEVSGYRRYLKEVRQGRRERPDRFEQILFGGRRSTEMQVLKQEVSERALNPENALEQVLEVSGSEKGDIFREVRGRGGNPVRTVAAWWLVVGAGLSNGEVGKSTKMSNAAVSRAIARVRSEIIRNPNGDIAEWVSSLREIKEKLQVEVPDP